MSVSPVKVRKRIRGLISFIESLDGFRIGAITNIDQLAIKYRQLDLSGRTRKWKEIKKDLEEIAVKGLRNPKIRELMQKDKKVEKYYKRVLIAFAASAILFLLGLPERLTFLLILATLTAANILLLYRLYIHDKITLLYYKNREAFRDQAERIRDDINRIINEIRREARRAKIDLSTMTLKVYNTDYDHIKIIKRPGKFSRHFKAVIEI